MPSERDEYGIPLRGSALHLAFYVNCASEVLEGAIRQELDLPGAPIEWVSPKAADRFAEFWDARFIQRVGHPELVDALKDWWPTGGPHWDGLARVDRDGALLVEAKANVPEMTSGVGSAAGGSGSERGLSDRRKIEAALADTRAALGVDEGDAATWLNSHCFQYANRLAHLRFFERCEVPAWLANVYFVEDPTHIATSRAAFDAQREADAIALGLVGRGVPNSAAVFLPAAPDAHSRLRRAVEQT